MASTEVLSSAGLAAPSAERGGVWLTATAPSQTPQVGIPFVLRKKTDKYCLQSTVFGHSFRSKNEFLMSRYHPKFAEVGHSFIRTFHIGGVLTVVTFTWTSVF